MAVSELLEVVGRHKLGQIKLLLFVIMIMEQAEDICMLKTYKQKMKY